MDVPPGLTAALAGRYRLEAVAGRGGMATVFRARDLKHARSVAIKVLRPEIAAAIGPDRFLREIEFAASIAHPHVVPLYDSGSAAGVLYCVMPLVDGQSLHDRLAEGPVSVPRAARWFRQLVDALGAAHARGIVHRDVKPGNVLLTGDHVVVTDFGIAKALHAADSGDALTTLGVAMGTPQYMAPEQALGEAAVDARADLFAAGAVAYHMLTGQSPFDAPDTRAVLSRVLSHAPPPPHEVRTDVPEALSAAVMACLEKAPEDRPESSRDLLDRLDQVFPASPAPGPQSARSREMRPLAVIGALVATLLALGGWTWHRHNEEVRVAREDTLPAAVRLANENRLAEAAQAALRAEEVLGSTPILDDLWERVTSPFRVVTRPAGARVRYRSYEDGGQWADLGTTPFETERFPVGTFRFRIELPGFEPEEKVRSTIPADIMFPVASAGFDYQADPSYVIDLDLVPEGSGPDGMIRVQGGLHGSVPMIGFGQVQPIPIPTFWLDRTEVTNAQFRDFVDAGGYSNPTWWRHPFVLDADTVEWETAIGTFQDATGRLGPSTWTLGGFDGGVADHPVGGVSWYEAAAYCDWRGGRLPTMYHWTRATLPSTDTWVPFNPALSAAANFSRTGPAAVGTYDAPGISGALDLAGNVREWVTTQLHGDPLLLGGAWNDLEYYLPYAFSASPWLRGDSEGFRCIQPVDGPVPEHLERPLALPETDVTRPVSISDEAFQLRRELYRYDQDAPLNTRLDSTRVTPEGHTLKWVTIDGVHGDRMPMRIHLPASGNPPFPPIIYFGAGNSVRATRMLGLREPRPQLLRAGYAIVEPVFDGTFQRNDGRTVARMGGPESQRLIANWIQELGRTIDYAEAMEELDGSRAVFLGESLGGSLGPIVLPFIARFKAAILLSAGIGEQASQEAIDYRRAIAGRTRMPVLVMGGARDASVRPDRQRAVYEAFGAAEGDKVFRLFDAGHWPLPMGEVLRETVDFLDRHVPPPAPPPAAP